MTLRYWLRASMLGIVMMAALAVEKIAAQAPLPEPSPAAPQTQPAAPPASKAQNTQDETPGYTFSKETRLVNVFTTVTDAHGAPIAGLTKDDFKVFEDGELQEIRVFDKESELPLSIVMELDTSLSTMKDLRLELESARKFVHSIMRSQDKLSLYTFDQDVDEAVPFTSDLKRIDRAIKAIRTGGSTAVFDALYLGSEALRTKQGRKVIVMITDGEDTGSKIEYASAVREAQESEAIVYSVIIVPIEADAGRNVAGENALIQISQDTGGKHYYASNIPQLEKAFVQISEELRTQYLLGYYPKQKLSDANFRKLDVTLDKPELTARHRTGYYTH